MLFTDKYFFLLVVITFCLFYAVRSRPLQVFVLIISSLVFYAYNSIPLTGLLLASAFITNLTSYFVLTAPEPSRKKVFAIVGVVANLLVLAYFKYGSLLSDTLKMVSGGGLDASAFIALSLPIGISFYTFQGVSMVVDTLRGDFSLEEDGATISFREYLQRGLFFIIFFPQLVAGPVLKAKDFLPQIRRKRLSEVDWDGCAKTIILGYFLKMVVANNFQGQTFKMSYPQFLGFSSPDCFLLEIDGI